MKLNKKSILNRFVYWQLGRESWADMPKSLCSYFWTALLTVVTFPVLILSRHFSIKMSNDGSREWPGLLTITFYFLIFLLEGFAYMLFLSLGILAVLGKDFPISDVSLFQLLWLPFAGILAFATLISIILLIVYIGYSLFHEDGIVREYVIPKIENKFDRIEEEGITKTRQLPLKYIKSIKDKVCPRIDYK